MDIKEIIDSVRCMTVPHPMFEAAFRQFSSAVELADEGTAVVLVGPTRVGKTTLVRRLIPELASPCPDGSKVPVLQIEAATTDRGFISTKYLIQQCLVEIKHPFHVDETYYVYRAAAEGTLTLRLIKAMDARGTRYLIVDEAHHLTRTYSTRLAIAAIDTLKCICNKTRAVLVLVSGYEILESIYLSAHFNGRFQLVNFANYSDDARSALDFDRLLATLDEHLPWKAGHSMLAHRDFIYRGSCGCYGMLLQWSKNAITEMVTAGDRKLTRAHYAKSLYERQVAAIRREIKDAGWYLERISSESASDVSDIENSVERPSKRHKPFTRTPMHDPVPQPRAHA